MGPFSDDPVVDCSLKHSIRDGMAYTVMSGGAESYFSAWALHFGAGTSQIGLLASLPALVGSFAQLLGAGLGRRIGRRATILGGAVLQGLVLLPMGLLPALAPATAVPAILACTALYHAGVNLAAPQWSSLMGDLVPAESRGVYFGLRNRLCSVTSFLSLVASGALLALFQKQGRATAGFLILFAVGLLARAVSTVFLAKMHSPPGRRAALDWPTRREWATRLKRSPFVRLTALSAATTFAVSVSGPFFVVYMLRDLGFDYLTFMLISATTVLVQFLTLQRWGRLGDRFGNRAVLAATGRAMPLLPALWLVSGHPVYLAFAQLAAGLVWAGWSLSLGNFLYDLVPPERRASRLALHSVAGGVAGFAGATLGGRLGEWLPALSAPFAGAASPVLGLFAVSALLRLLAIPPLLKGIEEVRPSLESHEGSLIFRVVAVRPLAGLVFAAVGRRKSKD